MARADEITGGKVELVRDARELRQLDPAWRELAVARGNAFVTPDWFWAWQRHYGDGHEPLVPVVRDSHGELLGLLPLVAERGRARTARFAGSSLGDYFHPASLPEDEAAVAAAAGALLTSGSSSPRAIVAENVDADASWWRTLSTSAGYASPLVDRLALLPTLPFAGRSWDEYLASRSRNLRSQLGRKRRALEREHDVSIRWTGTEDDLAAEMAMLFRLHDMRWKVRDRPSSLTSERARAFLTDFAAAARGHGWLRLGFLEIDRKPVAGWYGWCLGGRFSYYQAGFDPAWSDHSVGLLLFAETIRTAVEEGAVEYDMLLGEESFKARFADRSRTVTSAMIAPRFGRSRFLAATELRARRVGRRLPSSVRQRTKRGARSLLERLPMARRR